jgi:signal transduction histidine kinase
VENFGRLIFPGTSFFMNKNPEFMRFVSIFILMVLFLAPGRAQEGFDTVFTFDEIQKVIKSGITNRDLRQQGLGWYHWAQYNYKTYGRSDSSFLYLARSVEKFRQSSDTLAYFRAQIEMADWLSQRDLSEEALKIQEEALSYFQRTKEMSLEARTLVSMSRNYLAVQDTADALNCRRLFRERNKILKDTLLELRVLMEEVARLQSLSKYRDAINLSLRTLSLARATENSDFVAQSLYNLGLLSVQDQDFEAATKYLTEAEGYYQDPGYLQQRKNMYRLMAQSFDLTGKTDTAFMYSQKLVGTLDTTLARDRATALQKAAMQYNFGEKKRTIDILEEEKAEAKETAKDQSLLIAALFVGLAAVLLAGYFIVRDYRHRLQTNRVITIQKEALNQQEIIKLQNEMQIKSMQSMLDGQEQERRRIANDLHDSVGGLLSATKLQLEQLAAKNPELTQADDLGKVKSLLDDTVAETRHIARNLQPVSLEHFGLERAIQDLVNKLSGDGSPSITFQHYGPLDKLSETNTLHCYRIVQELLQNSLKHAEASEILIQLTGSDTEMTILVEDDGKGYAPDTVQAGMGTGNLAQRVQFLNGELNVEAAPGRGVSTHIVFPVGG